MKVAQEENSLSLSSSLIGYRVALPTFHLDKTPLVLISGKPHQTNTRQVSRDIGPGKEGKGYFKQAV